MLFAFPPTPYHPTRDDPRDCPHPRVQQSNRRLIIIVIVIIVCHDHRFPFNHFPRVVPGGDWPLPSPPPPAAATDDAAERPPPPRRNLSQWLTNWCANRMRTVNAAELSKSSIITRDIIRLCVIIIIIYSLGSRRYNPLLW